jgi:DNA-directed RNA polymerase subunit RPC12/RpoP
VAGRRETEWQKAELALDHAGIELGGVLGLPLAGEFPNAGYRVPAVVELADDRVRWQFWPDNNLSVTSAAPSHGAGEGALKDLLSIRDGHDVVRFVSRHGPLWLCSQHGSRECRTCVRPRREFVKLAAGGWLDSDNSLPPDVAAALHPQEEPVEGYRFYASVAGALLRVIAQVVAGKVAGVDDILVLFQWRWRDDWGWPLGMRPDKVTRDDVQQLFTVTPRDGSSEKPLTGAKLSQFRLLWSRLHLTEALNHWLDLGAPGPRLNPVWCAEPMLATIRPAMLLTSADAFGVIGLELLAAAVGGAVAICSLCGRPYPRRVSPTRTRNNYCPDCKGKRADAYRQRRSRDRRAAKKAAQAAVADAAEPKGRSQDLRSSHAARPPRGDDAAGQA